MALSEKSRADWNPALIKFDLLKQCLDVFPYQGEIQQLSTKLQQKQQLK